MIIELGDRVFNGPAADADGSFWYVEEWSGWDSPELRQGVDDPTGVHGGILMESLLGTRLVTLRGVVKAPSEEVFWNCWNSILGLTNNLVLPRTLTVHEFVPKTLDVIRGGPPRLTIIGVGAFRFELELLALNPIKKTAAAKTVTIGGGGSATLDNLGTFDAEPLVKATTIGAVSLVNETTSAVLSTGGVSVPSGTVFDYPSRTVTSGGTNLFNTVTRESVWWSLKPGANVIRNTGSASVSLTYHDTWI